MPAKFVYSAPVHLNGNIFAAVDTETTGLDPEKHSIIEVCVLPLNADYSVNKSIVPFNMQMQPIAGKAITQEALDVNKIDLAWVMLNCVDAYRVADLLVEWFERLELGPNKQIVPIAHNWPFDRAFLISWLGYATFDMIFNRYYRDTMALASGLNDRADMVNQPCPYPKQSLSNFAHKFGIENPDPHRALGDAYTTALVYKQLLMQNL